MSRANTAAIVAATEADPGLARRGADGLILIAGAGIAGLATALALARRGIASHVLEKRPEFSEEGAGIQIGPNGTRILAELGVADILRPHVGTPLALRIMDGVSGSELTRLPLGSWIVARHGAPYWTAHRADLHAALLSRVHSDALVRHSMSSAVQEVEQSSQAVNVATSAGQTHHGEALIVADGASSMLRGSALRNTMRLRFTGRSALRAVILSSQLPRDLEEDCVHLWLCPHAHVVHYPVRNGAETAVVLIVNDTQATSGWSTGVLPGWVDPRIATFPDQLRQLLQEPKAWRKWPLMIPKPGSGGRWTKGRVALIGDAAHPILPFLAQGGVMALEDAAVLASCLAGGGGEITPALKRYASKRRSRTARVAVQSRRNGQIYQLTGLLARGRDAILRATPPELIMRRFDWLYGWL